MKNKKILRLVFMALGLALIIAGIITKDYENIFRKSSMICFECIGIG